MKNDLRLLLLLPCLLVLLSCSTEWNTYTRLYAVNTTTDTFRIRVEYPDFPQENYQRRVLPNGKRTLVSTYYTELETKPSVRNLHLWVYNEADSTYMKLSNCDSVTKIQDNYNEFVDDSRTGNSRLDPNYAEILLSLRIEPSIKTGMIQDTLLTDSIFNLKIE